MEYRLHERISQITYYGTMLPRVNLDHSIEVGIYAMLVQIVEFVCLVNFVKMCVIFVILCNLALNFPGV